MYFYDNTSLVLISILLKWQLFYKIKATYQKCAALVRLFDSILVSKAGKHFYGQSTSSHT